LSKKALEQRAIVAKESDTVVGVLLFSEESQELEFLVVLPAVP
jgi:hypothetical protein